MFFAHEGNTALRDSALNPSDFRESVLLCPEETVSAVKVDAGDAGLPGMPADASSSGENNRVSLGGLKCAGRGGGEYESMGSRRSVGLIVSELLLALGSSNTGFSTEASRQPPVEFDFCMVSAECCHASIAFAEMFVLAFDRDAATSDCRSFSAYPQRLDPDEGNLRCDVRLLVEEGGDVGGLVGGVEKESFNDRGDG